MDHLRKQYLALIDGTLEFLRGKNEPVLTLSTPTPAALVAPVSPIVEVPKKVVSAKNLKKNNEPPKPHVTAKKEAPVERPVETPINKSPTPKTIMPKTIALTTPAKPTAPVAHSSFVSFMKNDFPHTRLHKKPQVDNRAKAVRFAWKDKQNLSSVPLLYDESLLPFKLLLENIAKAISLIFKSSRLLDVTAMHSNNSWETLLEASDITLVVVPDSLLNKYQTLSSLTQDDATRSTLGTHPLLHLPDLSLYQKDPLLKRSLWDTLCQKLQKS